MMIRLFEYDGPRYRLVMDRLKEQIITGQLRPGDRFEPVRTLAATWKISHATAAKVLREMQREGWAYVEGNATLVRDRGQAEITLSMAIKGGRSRKKSNGGGAPSYPGMNEVTEAGIVVAPDYVCDVMGLERGSEVLRREVVLRSQTDPQGSHRPEPGAHIRPYCLYVSWHPAHFAEAYPDVLNVGRDDATSPLVYLYVAGIVMEEALGRNPDRGLDSFHTRTTDQREARLLEINEGDPILARIETWEDDEGVTEYMESCYRMGVVLTMEHRSLFDVDEVEE